MSKIAAVARYLLGLLFLVMGANGLMMIYIGKGFIPAPPPSPAMQNVMGGLMAMGYLMPMVKWIETCAGLLLLTGKFTNLAIILLGPVVVNILGVHLFVEPEGLPIAIGVVTLWTILFVSRWSYFRPIFKA